MPFNYYRRLTSAQKQIYRQSDQLLQVPLSDTRKFHPLVTDLAHSLTGNDRVRVEQICSQLLAGINQQLGAPPVSVKVLARRPSDDWGELHGLYEPAEGKRRARITVWMRTAKRKQVVAFKTFLRTVLHELCHHLDYEYFQLDDSFHTEGFYQRESHMFYLLTGETRPPKQHELF